VDCKRAIPRKDISSNTPDSGSMSPSNSLEPRGAMLGDGVRLESLGQSRMSEHGMMQSRTIESRLLESRGHGHSYKQEEGNYGNYPPRQMYSQQQQQTGQYSQYSGSMHGSHSPIGQSPIGPLSARGSNIASPPGSVESSPRAEAPTHATLPGLDYGGKQQPDMPPANGLTGYCGQDGSQGPFGGQSQGPFANGISKSIGQSIASSPHMSLSPRSRSPEQYSRRLHDSQNSTDYRNDNSADYRNDNNQQIFSAPLNGLGARIDRMPHSESREHLILNSDNNGNSNNNKNTNNNVNNVVDSMGLLTLGQEQHNVSNVNTNSSVNANNVSANANNKQLQQQQQQQQGDPLYQQFQYFGAPPQHV
jgi:hypothetical protein